MAYLDRVFENRSETVTIPNPVVFTSTVNLASATVTGMTLTASVVAPDADDGAALGSTSLKWSDLFLASGGVINFDSGDVTLTHSSNLLTLDGGGLTVATGYNVLVTKGTLNVGAFSSTATGSGVALSNSVTAASRIYSDDAGSAISAAGSVPDVRGFLSRVLLTTDNSSNKLRLWGVMGHIKSYDGEWATEQVGGVHGYLELVRNAGTINFQGYGVSAGVQATVESSGTMTIDANHVIAGVAAISKLTSGLTQTGRTAAFYAGIYDISNWSDSTARSTWANGLYVQAGATAMPIRIGASSSSAQVGHHLTSTNSRAIGCYTDDNNAALAGDVQAIQSRMAIFAAQNGGAGGEAIRGHLRIVAANIIPNSSKAWYATNGYVEISGTSSVGDGTNWTVVAGLGATVEGATTTVAANGCLAGLHIVGKTLPGSPTGECVGIMFQAHTQGFEHAFGFSGVGTTDGNGLTTGSDSANVTHKLAIWINGVGTRYLHVFSD